MTKSTFLIGLMFVSFVSFGQNISVTFTGKGAATQIDSVTATNLKTNESVTLPGNETLILTDNTGIPTVSALANMGVVYPNPFSGRATFSMTVQNPQAVFLSVQNFVGQVVAQTKAFVQPGENEFDLSLGTAGIYMVSLTSDQGTAIYKVICTDATGSKNRIEYLGTNNHNNLTNPGLKTSPTTYTLGYTSGEIILYRCFSGIYTTIVTDSLISPKNYEVEFIPCSDPDGRNYAVVHIGDQTWMAENLAWLPSVSSLYDGSDTSPYYYVYGFESNNIIAAKATGNYNTYGVLYNWPAALTACPSGWHLPTDDEWKILETDQGMSPSDADDGGYERNTGTVGGKLKESRTAHWHNPNTGATNSSGFTALPGGQHYSSENLGYQAFFWTSSEGGMYAWYRNLNWLLDGVVRGTDYRSSGFSVRCLNDKTEPTARFTYDPVIGTTLTTFQFDASGSTDAETATADIEVRWDWNGDSIWDTRYDTLKTNSFQFPATGSYTVILEVKDGDGLVDTETKTVTVADGTITDPRDGHTYLYKTIGTQTWMAENLAYLPRVSPSSARSETDPYYYVYGYEGSTVDSAKGNANYTTFGVLYNWPAAMNGASGSDSVPSGVQGVCPDGWHLPSAAEWHILTDYLGFSPGTKMKAISGWSGNGNGDNSSGFTALPGGSGGFDDLGNRAYFWSSTRTESWSNPGILFLSFYSEVNWVDSPWNPTSSWGSSVRCLKDDAKPTAFFTYSPAIGTTLTNFQFDASGSTDAETDTADLEVRWDWNGDSIWDTDYGKVKTGSHQYNAPGSYKVILEVKDGNGLVDTETKAVMVGDSIFTDSRDGQDYVYKTIGTQTWMIENLAYLPAVSPSNTGSESEIHYYVYGFEGTSAATAKQQANYTTYGVLYNWPAAMNGSSSSTSVPSGVQGICPDGWHLPNNAEWTILEDYLGEFNGKKMKSTTGWAENGNGDNSSGFNALPGGHYSVSEGFSHLGSGAYFWSATEYGASGSWNYGLSSIYNLLERYYGSMRGLGFSVRCLKDN